MLGQYNAFRCIGLMAGQCATSISGPKTPSGNPPRPGNESSYPVIDEAVG